MSEIPPRMYAEIKISTNGLPELDVKNITRWVGISDKRRPNTKRPCYLRIKTVQIDNPVLMCKDGAVVIRQRALDLIQDKMSRSILGEIGLQFIAANATPPERRTLTYEKFAELREIMGFAAGKMRFDDGLPKPRMVLGDVVDAIRYASEGRYGWNAELKDKSNYLVLGGSVS